MPFNLVRTIARNASDLATLSSVMPAISTNMAIGNLQKDRRARVFRWSWSSASPSVQVILGTWSGSSYWVSGLGLDRHNFSSAAQYRFFGYPTTDQSGAASVDSGLQSAYNAAALGPFTWGQTPLGVDVKDGYLGFQYTVGWFARTLIKSFRLEIYDDQNTAGYGEMSRLIVGDYTEFTRAAQWGLKFGWAEKTSHTHMDGGTTISDGDLPYRIVRGAIPGLVTTYGATSDERVAFMDLTRFVGKRKSFLITFARGEGAGFERDLTLLRAKFDDVPILSLDLPDAVAAPFSIFEA